MKERARIKDDLKIFQHQFMMKLFVEMGKTKEEVTEWFRILFEHVRF